MYPTIYYSCTTIPPHAQSKRPRKKNEKTEILVLKPTAVLRSSWLRTNPNRLTMRFLGAVAELTKDPHDKNGAVISTAGAPKEALCENPNENDEAEAKIDSTTSASPLQANPTGSKIFDADPNEDNHKEDDRVFSIRLEKIVQHPSKKFEIFDSLKAMLETFEDEEFLLYNPKTDESVPHTSLDIEKHKNVLYKIDTHKWGGKNSTAVKVFLSCHIIFDIDDEEMKFPSSFQHILPSVPEASAALKQHRTYLYDHDGLTEPKVLCAGYIIGNDPDNTSRDAAAQRLAYHATSNSKSTKWHSLSTQKVNVPLNDTKVPLIGVFTNAANISEFNALMTKHKHRDLHYMPVDMRKTNYHFYQRTLQQHVTMVAACTALTIKNINQANLLFGEDDDNNNYMEIIRTMKSPTTGERLIIDIAATNEDRTVKPIVPRVLAREALAALEQFFSQQYKNPEGEDPPTLQRKQFEARKRPPKIPKPQPTDIIGVELQFLQNDAQ